MASSKQAEKENDNFNRYTRLLQDVAPKVLRKLFETRALDLKQVPTINLFLADSNVKNTLQQHLVKIRVLRQQQLDLLYPPDGSTVKMEDWDITLLCALLKNTCNLDQQELANVKKIRNIRNTTSGHKPGASLSNQDFTRFWSDLWSVIDDVLKAINDQEFHVEIAERVSSMLCDKDTGLLEEIVNTWRKDDKYFVETRACVNIQRRLESNPIVTISGISGSGKSGIAHHVALMLAKQEDYTIYPVIRAEDIEKYANIKERQVFVLDDPVGKHALDLTELQQFEKNHQNISTLPMKGQVKLILTCGTHIVNDKQFESYKTVVGLDTVDLCSEENRLSTQEKKCMFERYARSANLSSDDKHSIIEKENYLRFPLLCKVFGANLDKLEKQAVDFFSRPFPVLLQEVQNIEERAKYQYCSLLLCLIFQNSFDLEYLHDSSETTFKHKRIQIMTICDVFEEAAVKPITDAFESLTGVYYIREGDRFRFMHDVLFDVVAYQFGKYYPCEMLKYCSSSFIREYVRTEHAPSADKYAVRIHQEHYTELTNRLYSDLDNGDFHNVFLNPSMHDESFLKVFCKFTSNMERDRLVTVYRKKCSNEKGYKSPPSKDLQKWHKNGFIKLALDNINTKAIHWIMAYNHMDIFCACHSVAKSFKLRSGKNKALRKFKPLFGKTANQQWDYEETMVLMACLSGNVIMLNIVQNNYPKVNLAVARDSYERNAMHMAAVSGEIDMVKMLIPTIGEMCLNCYDTFDITPLFLAAAMGHSNICTYMVQNGAHVNIGKRNGPSPLYIAAKEGHTETATALLEHGANVNMWNTRNGSFALLKATSKGHIEMISLLLANGADVNKINRKGSFPLYLATKKGRTEIVSLLLENGANVRQTHDGSSPLHTATDEGNTEIADLLLKHKADVNQINKHGMSPLHAAVERGHTDIVRRYIQHGACIHQTDEKGSTLLWLAAKHGHKEIVSILLEHKTDASKTNEYGSFPLYEAAAEGHTEIVGLLLECKADISQGRGSRFSPLHAAAMKDKSKTVKVLLSFGAETNQLDSNGDAPLHLAALKGNAYTISLLLKYGADVNLCIRGGFSPLYAAACKGHTNTVKILLQHGANINTGTHDGETPLCVAARQGRTETVAVLLEHGADVNKTNSEGTSPLFEAISAGHTYIVRLLLQNGADVNQINSEGNSPLCEASTEGHTDIVRELLKHKASVNKINSNGSFALYEAIVEGRTDTVRLLLQYGADVNQTNSEGNSSLCEASTDVNLDINTPLYIATKLGRIDIVFVLLKYKADINRVSTTGNTALIAASKAGYSIIVKTLLEFGANVNIRTIDTGRTALMEAARAGCLDAVQALLYSRAKVNIKASTSGRTALMEAAKSGHLDVVRTLIDHGADVNSRTSDIGRTALMEAAKYGHLGVVQPFSVSE